MFFNGLMTLSVRNGLLALAFSVLLLMALGYGLLSFVLLTQEGWNSPVGDGTLIRLVLETVIPPLVGLIGFFPVRRAFRKSTVPEVFFLALFLATLSGETLLLLQAWITFHGLSWFITALLTRTVWAFRFTGLFLLLCSSLFAFEFAYRKYANLVAGSLAGGIFLAVIMPLHSTSARNHLLFSIGDTPGTVLVAVLLMLTVVANFVLGSRRPGAPRQARIRALATIFFLAGWGSAVIWGPWGTGLVIPGIILVTWKTEENILLR
jgi:hypothetical protein